MFAWEAVGGLCRIFCWSHRLRVPVVILAARLPIGTFSQQMRIAGSSRPPIVTFARQMQVFALPRRSRAAFSRQIWISTAPEPYLSSERHKRWPTASANPHLPRKRTISVRRTATVSLDRSAFRVPHGRPLVHWSVAGQVSRRTGACSYGGCQGCCVRYGRGAGRQRAVLGSRRGRVLRSARRRRFVQAGRRGRRPLHARYQRARAFMVERGQAGRAAHGRGVPRYEVERS